MDGFCKMRRKGRVLMWIVEYTFKKRKKKIKVLEFFPSKKAALKFAGKCLFDVKIYKLRGREK